MKPNIIILILVCIAFIPEILYIIKLFTKKTPSIQLPKITLRANIVIFIIGILLIGIILIYDVNYLNYKSPVEYKDWKKITWSDFRGIKRPKQTLDGNKKFAFICSAIKYNYAPRQVEIKSLFYPARSYTFNKKLAGKNLLEHELYHFHITEYWSRMLRKAIIKMEDQSEKSAIISLISVYRNKEKAMQANYDDTTYHGYVLGKQHEWQQKIDSSLSSLENYSNSIINLKIQKHV